MLFFLGVVWGGGGGGVCARVCIERYYVGHLY